MKKNFKKIAAASLAATMALSMGSFAALAADITISSNSADAAAHTYAAYQIFAGTTSGDKLNVTGWGTGVDGTALLTALKAETGFSEGVSFSACNTAESVAEIIGGFSDDSSDAKLFAQVVGKSLSTQESGTFNTNTISGVDAGYYLIKDKEAVTGAGASTSFILKVIDKDITVNVKSGVPTLEKKVLEGDYTSATDEKAKYGDKYNDVADYSIGDEISFRLYGTVADNFADFSGAYWYQFTDTKSEGLTFVDEDSDKKVDIKATIGVGGQEIPAGSYSVEMVNNNSFTVTFKDLKQVAGVSKDSTIVVEYKAKLNEKAVIGNPGNPNEAKLTFANNPNSDAGYDENGKPDDEGETPEDKVVVLTYSLDVNKVEAGTKNKLAGVVFKLKNAAGEYIVVDKNNTVTGADATGSELTTNASGLIELKGIEDGVYTLEEVKALAGYKPIAPVKLTITATTLNGQTWNGADAPLTEIKLNDEVMTENKPQVTVANSKLSALPSTGGIGTTIFYVVGLVLMAGAAVVLIAKRKAAEE